eukprot:scaffold507_cov36-Phaeocystis_antarctica.AAC.1
MPLPNQARFLESCPRLQPYVPQAATLCTSGCNPMYLGLQPYAHQAATLCTSGALPRVGLHQDRPRQQLRLLPGNPDPDPNPNPSPDPNPSPSPDPNPNPNPSPDPNPSPNPNPNPNPNPSPSPDPNPNPNAYCYCQDVSAVAGPCDAFRIEYDKLVIAVQPYRDRVRAWLGTGIGVGLR